MNKLLWVLVYLCFSTVVFSCSKKDKDEEVTPVTPPPVVQTKTLKEKAAFPIGAAVTVAHLKDANFSTVFKTHYNQLTAEYEMKMKNLWASETQFTFSNADYLVDYATQNSMRIHGHALLWYSSVPDWLKNANYDSATFENHIKNFITQVVSRYKGKIVSWDVANEIFADNGSLRDDATVTKIYKDPIRFYGRCFKYAREADPAVKLFYNDYDMVLNSTKRYYVKKMVERFKAEGYPIDGLGEQCHTTVWTNHTTLGTGLNDLASTGLLIHISEIDMRVNQNKSDTYVFTEAEQQKQSDKYKSVVEIFEALPQAQKFAITIWGISDKSTWLTGWWHPKEYPLLFDVNYNKKKAYDGFLAGLK